MWLKEQNKRIKEGKGLAKSLSGRKLVSDKAECIFFSISRSMPTENVKDPCRCGHLKMRLAETFPHSNLFRH